MLAKSPPTSASAGGCRLAVLQGDMTSEPELGSRIADGDQAELFEFGKDVCKLYKSHIRTRDAKSMAVREARALKIVAAFDDVPAPRVLGVRQYEGRWGVRMTRLEGQNFKRLLGDGRDPRPYMAEMARLHVAIHGHPAPPQLLSLKAWLTREIRKTGEVDATFPVGALLQRLAEMPEGDRLCHGDFHFSNVMGRLGNASIIDWPSAMRGHPAADVCQSWLLMQRPPGEQDAVAYVEAYADESGMTVKDILDWRAIVAGARLADNVPDEVARLKQIVAEGLSQ
jgi:aminoglycoside phosphotransferase (APT) family kinase protein